ncbi:MAG: iron-containing alcohol dehydrogenase [Firmicutes bacterium]|nr:iron-containing alcohol dehydrogenase [Bacillota bacterium]
MSRTDNKGIKVLQTGMGIGMKAIKVPRPVLYEGPGSSSKLREILEGEGKVRPLIVTTPGTVKRDYFAKIMDSLLEGKLEPVVFGTVKNDPTISVAKEIAGRYADEECDCMIAIGGGSPMDAMKGAAALLAKPGKDLRQMQGLLKVGKKTPLMIAVPTTAGTGSECTIAAVITDESSDYKFTVSDLSLCPKYAILDAGLTLSLPRDITAMTGMDALTHAVEAYLNRPFHKRDTRELCESAVSRIFRSLETACDEPDDIAARQNMLKASFEAGEAFTVACVGNVHAIGHGIGGIYHKPHGLCMAVLLPIVLLDYGEAAYGSLSRLAKRTGVIGDDGSSDRIIALRFIEMIRELNFKLGIPAGFPDLEDKDMDEIARRAVKEAVPLYPTPVTYSEDDVRRILTLAKGD